MSNSVNPASPDKSVMFPNRLSSFQSRFDRRFILQNLGLAGGAGLLQLLAPWSCKAESLFPWRIGTSESNSAFRVGEFKKIYDPSLGEAEKWYINDHTFIRAKDARWHLFGITHPEPAAAQKERFFAHANAPNITGPWTKHAAIMHVDGTLGETVVWAPYVLEHEDLYWMYYCGGGVAHERYHIHLATSSDLFTWVRQKEASTTAASIVIACSSVAKLRVRPRRTQGNLAPASGKAWYGASDQEKTNQPPRRRSRRR